MARLMRQNPHSNTALVGKGRDQPACHLHDGSGPLEGRHLELDSCMHPESAFSTKPWWHTIHCRESPKQ